MEAATDTFSALVVCAGPYCERLVEPDVEGFHCSTACLVAEAREHGDA